METNGIESLRTDSMMKEKTMKEETQTPTVIYQHFDRLLAETEDSIFYVSTKGYAYEIDKSKERKTLRTYKPWLDRNGIPKVDIECIKDINFAHVVYAMAKDRYVPKGYVLVHSNGRRIDCNITNLNLVSLEEVERKTREKSKGVPKPVVVTLQGGERKTFGSINLASEYLKISTTALSYHVKGIRPCNKLKRMGITIEWCTERNTTNED